MSTEQDEIRIGECCECRSPVHDGPPQTTLEAWSGRNLYCDGCLDALFAAEPTEDGHDD